MGIEEEVWTLMQRINERLEEATASGELHAVLTSGELAEARELASILDRADPEELAISMAAVALHLLGTLRWYRHQLVPEGEQDGNRRDAVNYFVVPYVLGLDDIPEPLLPELAGRAIPSALAIHESAVQTCERDQIDSTIRLWRRLDEHLTAGHPSHAGINANLGCLLLCKFESDRSIDDVNQAVGVLEAALAGAVDGALRGDIRLTLVKALRSRRADPADLDRIIELCADGVAAATAASELSASWLARLADNLMERYEHTRATTDLDRAIDAARSSLAIAPTSSTDLRYDLAWALAHRFELTGSAADRAEAIRTARTVVDTARPDDTFWEPARKVLEAMLHSVSGC